MNYPHLADRLYGVPLLIHRDKADILAQVFLAYASGEADRLPDVTLTIEQAQQARIGAYSGLAMQSRDDKPYAVTKGGVAIVPVMGTLMQRGSGLGGQMDAMSGLSTYRGVASMLQQAEQDPDVRGTLLELDSHGGEPHGLPELGDIINRSRQSKPVWSHVNEKALSAGYWVAASTDRIVVPVTGMVGSIGAILLFVDQSKYDEKRGYSYEVIADGDRKADGNPHAPLSDSARARMTSEVRRLGLMFREHVASMRGLDESAVRATQAGLMNPQEALDGGYVDAIGTFAETVGEFEQHLASKSFSTGTRQASQSTSKETSMEGNNQGAAVTLTAEQQAAQQQAIEAARVEGEKAGRTAGMQAERERIGAILGCDEAKGRTALARHIANQTSMTADEAKTLLAASPLEQATTGLLSAAMNGVQNPNVGANAGDVDEEEAAAMRIAGYTQPAARQQ